MEGFIELSGAPLTPADIVEISKRSRNRARNARKGPSFPRRFRHKGPKTHEGARGYRSKKK